MNHIVDVSVIETSESRSQSLECVKDDAINWLETSREMNTVKKFVVA